MCITNVMYIISIYAVCWLYETNINYKLEINIKKILLHFFFNWTKLWSYSIEILKFESCFTKFFNIGGVVNI